MYRESTALAGRINMLIAVAWILCFVPALFVTSCVVDYFRPSQGAESDRGAFAVTMVMVGLATFWLVNLGIG